MPADIANLYAGYTVIWGGLIIYIIYLHWKQRQLEKDLSLLIKMIPNRDE